MLKTIAERKKPARNSIYRGEIQKTGAEWLTTSAKQKKTTEEWKKPLRNGKNQREMQGHAVVLHSAPVNCISQPKKTENQSIVHVNIVNRPGTEEKPKTAGA